MLVAGIRGSFSPATCAPDTPDLLMAAMQRRDISGRTEKAQTKKEKKRKDRLRQVRCPCRPNVARPSYQIAFFFCFSLFLSHLSDSRNTSTPKADGKRTPCMRGMTAALQLPCSLSPLLRGGEFKMSSVAHTWSRQVHSSNTCGGRTT